MLKKILVPLTISVSMLLLNSCGYAQSPTSNPYIGGGYTNPGSYNNSYGYNNPSTVYGYGTYGADGANATKKDAS